MRLKDKDIDEFKLLLGNDALHMSNDEIKSLAQDVLKLFTILLKQKRQNVYNKNAITNYDK